MTTMYKDRLGFANRAHRAAFKTAWRLGCMHTPRRLHRFRVAILRSFGAVIDEGCSVYPDAKIWAPWNLVMHFDSCLADGVDCYNVDRIEIGRHAVVSQRAYLCSAGHDFNDSDFALTTQPIILRERVWVAAEAFIGPGVTMHEGSVAAARAVVTKDVDPWTIVAGNPARPIGERKLR